eukprot:TRINITY_DN1111_c0_g1_i10.p1 TRINITY_DN1111_c0_g1~~TRINITY_DN1111_c0_g1_i10.p1  ORF type:complete len:192 (+),score=31.88 TRINITY_DN1111_c0_g1_i10:249-824(+)
MCVEVVAVFAADMEILSDLDKQTRMAIANGAPEVYAKEGLPKGMKVLSNGYPGWLIRTMVYNLTWSLTSVLSWFKPGIPVPAPPEAWAMKQTMMAADHFMLAATVHGMGTSCMEGFNQAAIRNTLGIPARYAIPCIVAVGYPDMDPRAGERYDPEEVIREDHFSEPYRGVTPATVTESLRSNQKNQSGPNA